MSWISTGATVFAAAVGAVSVAIPLVFGLLEKFDKYAAERAVHRGQLPKGVGKVDAPASDAPAANVPANEPS